MIYTIYGEDKIKAKEKARDLVVTLLKKKPNASYFKITNENYSKTNLDELIKSAGLFESKFIILLDNLFEDKELKKEILENMKEMKESDNVFIVLESDLDKKSVGMVDKYSKKTQNFILTQMGTGEKKWNLKDFNIFSLGDALGNRDKKKLWVLYTQAVERGIPSEEICGTFFWQVKSIKLAQKSRTAEEAGINPFVYRKLLQFSKNFTEKELKNISSKLVSIYHNSHRGLTNFEIALEKFILEI